MPSAPCTATSLWRAMSQNETPCSSQSRATAFQVEENAYRQYMAMQIGEPYVFSEAEQKASRDKLWTPSLFKKTWDHYYSKLTPG